MKVKRTIEMFVKKFEVGDIISFKLTDGEKVEAMAVKQDGENMIFCFVNCLKEDYRMNATSANGWDTCELRQKLNEEIINKFPKKIRKKLISSFDNGDLLRIPTEKEIFGNNIIEGAAEPEEVEQWEPMKFRKNIICFHNKKENKSYWLQNIIGKIYFAMVDIDGSYTYTAPSCEIGVRPVFSIKNL